MSGTKDKRRGTGRWYRLHNRRVFVGQVYEEDGTPDGWVLSFKRLGEKDEPKVVVTTIALSEEAMTTVIAGTILQREGRNPNHYGIHCAGLCEGAAYVAKIRGLESKVRKQKGSLEEQLRTINALMTGVGGHTGKDGTTPVLRYIARLETELSKKTAECNQLREHGNYRGG